MTKNHEKHLEQIKQAVAVRLDGKYRRGQKEHGGSLWMRPMEDLLEDAIDEAIDQLTYLITARARLNDLRNGE
jgi:predicted component of type VI protein secretion system